MNWKEVLIWKKSEFYVYCSIKNEHADFFSQASAFILVYKITIEKYCTDSLAEELVF
jgi:hypothetical protein